jgi:enolase
MKHLIEKISVEEIFDSRNKPTLLVTVFCSAVSGSFAVPSGASTGMYEAHELRDADGRGVQKAIKNIETIIAPALSGHDVTDQRAVDDLLIALDGTENKSHLGGNAMIGVSIACAKCAARAMNLEVFEYLRTLKEIRPSRQIPYLYMNLINGGKHATNGLAFQEYHIVPECPTAQEAYDLGVQVYETLEDRISELFGQDALILGDEGGFAPPLSDVKAPLGLLAETVQELHLQDKISYALDVAASSFYIDGKYDIAGKQISKEELASVYAILCDQFPMLSIEDPFEEEDFESFTALRQSHPDLFVMADDLTVTNVSRTDQAIKQKSINAMIIKPNQVGTLSETLDAMKLARDHNVHLIVSHRSGETMDDFIADLTYAFGCFGLKTGAPLKPERKVKYDRLLAISKQANTAMNGQTGKLIVVRHAESEWNSLGKWTGLYDSHLTPNGHRKSAEIGESLKDLSFDHAFTSTLSRSKQTLSSLLAAHNEQTIPTIEHIALNERDYGDYTGENKWEVQSRVGEETFNSIRRSWDYPIPNGETLKMVYERTVPYFQDTIVPLLNSGKNVLIVSHGNAIRALVKYIESVSDADIANVEMQFGAIHLYDLDRNGRMIRKEIRQI